MRRFLAISILLFFFLGIILAYDYYDSIYVKTYDYNKELVVKKGESVKSILEQAGLSYDYKIRLYLKLKDIGKNVKAGSFTINEKFTIEKLFEKLQTNSQNYIKTTIPEGYTLKQIKNLLVQKNLININKFEAALEQKKDFYYPTPNGNFEGYFYPDTYYFTGSQSEEEIIEMFLKRFMEKFPKEKFPNKKDFYERLVLASIIEKEAANDSEKYLVASVFQNRLDINMKLQSNATLAYLFDYLKSEFTYDDIKIDSKYNTYLVKGLTPTPICNPGEVSVFASLNPQKSDYFYFVLSKEGKHIFSKTYKEHIKNRRANE